MKADVENYRGIEFIRISRLPEDQKRVFRASVHGPKIIKILRDTELLNDCLLYGDYSAWYQDFNKAMRPQGQPVAVRAKELKLALK